MEKQETQTNDEAPLTDIKSLIEDITKDKTNNKIPIFIAFLAAFLALVSMADDEAAKSALEAQIEASNKFAYFQAKNIRATNSEIAANTFQSTGNNELALKWQKKADRYNAEKGDILKDARKQQAERTIAIERGDNYGVAVALLQIAIVMASISLITGGGFLLGVSFTLSLIAAIFVANGYGLYFNLPTDPKMIVESLANLSG